MISTEFLKNELAIFNEFDKFDVDIQINLHSTGGHFGMPCLDRMYYYTIGKKKIKFKYETPHGRSWEKYVINNKTYLYSFFGEL
jgi:hypothetical protein